MYDIHSVSHCKCKSVHRLQQDVRYAYRHHAGILQGPFEEESLQLTILPLMNNMFKGLT